MLGSRLTTSASLMKGLRHHSSIPSISTQFESLRDRKNGPAVLISQANQIHINLALESYLMDVVKPKVPVFFWWRNDKNVVIGRNQNPWKECDTAKMEEDHIELARRFSGGGAVYQDLGNSCFTFLIPESLFKKSLNNEVMLNVIKNQFGVDGEASGRNDLVSNGRKFSGAAFKHIKDPVNSNEGLSLHHGTFLINTDFTALQKYLTPNKLKLQAKGISSIVSRVVNLSELNSDITHESLIEPLTKEFQGAYSNSERPQKPQVGEVYYEHAFMNAMQHCYLILGRTSEFMSDPEFQKILSQLTDWEWRFGRTPQFSHTLEKKFDWGLVEVNLDVKDGVIRSTKIFSDCLIPDIVQRWEAALTGCQYTTESVKQLLDCVQPVGEDNHQCALLIKDFSDWVVCEMQ